MQGLLRIGQGDLDDWPEQGVRHAKRHFSGKPVSEAPSVPLPGTEFFKECLSRGKRSVTVVHLSCHGWARQMASVRELNFDRLMLLRTAMHRILNFGIALFLICAHPLRASNPEDLEFRLGLARDTRVYHLGESVPIEISYSSQVEKKYYRSFSGPPAHSDAVTPQITPTDGVLDLRELRRDLRGGWGSSGVAGFGYVGPQPVTQQLDLCEWYRFLKAGHYSVIFTSTEFRA